MYDLFTLLQLMVTIDFIYRIFKMQKKKNAFTLVELSVVLVIIGLLVASITAGKSLIRSSRISALISQINNLEAAVANFTEQYGTYPGDFSNASTVFGCSFTGCNGNGDGYINFTGSSANTEVYHFFTHLSLAGLLDGQYTGVNIPYVKWNSSYMTMRYVGFISRTGHGLEVGGINGYGLANINKFAAQDVYELDVKIDDGVAYTGNVYGLNNTSPGTIATNNTTNGVGCGGYSTAGYDYALKAQTITCFIVYWMKSMN